MPLRHEGSDSSGEAVGGIPLAGKYAPQEKEELWGFADRGEKKSTTGTDFAPRVGCSTKIEDELLKNKKIVVYGIYFDYNSDQIKKESEQVLREIAVAMKNNPDWKLTVDGHTDSIGGDAYNLDLSKRRAAAVKQALVDRFQIGRDRWLTDGFGMLASGGSQ